MFEYHAVHQCTIPAQGLLLPWCLTLIACVAVSAILFQKVGDLRNVTATDLVIEYRFFLFLLIWFSLTFGCGYLATLYDKEVATGFMWTFVTMKFSWMFVLVIVGCNKKREIYQYLGKRFCYSIRDY